MLLKDYKLKLQELLYREAGLTYTESATDEENTFYYKETQTPIFNYLSTELVVIVNISKHKDFNAIINNNISDKIRKIGINIRNIGFDNIYNKGELILDILSDCEE